MNPVFRIHLFYMWIRIQVSKIFLFFNFFLTKQNFQIIFACLNCMNHSETRKFLKPLLFNSSDLVLSKFVVVAFLVHILPLRCGSVDPHILADPDPGSQNLADPTDPDPKHWNRAVIFNIDQNIALTLNIAKNRALPFIL